MSIHTRIRILWGLFGSLVFMAAMSLAYAGALNDNATASYPGEPAHAAMVRMHLNNIWGALYDYAEANHHQFPPRLSMLYPTYVSDPAIFWSPGDSDLCPTTIDNDEPNRPNSAQVSFFYRPPVGDYDSVAPSPTILVQDNSLSNNQGSGIYAHIGGEDIFFAVAPSAPVFAEAGRQDLQQLDTALHLFAQANASRFPTKLSMLYPQYATSPSLFWNTGDDLFGTTMPTTINNDTPDAENSALISYDYDAAGQPTGGDPGQILLQDNAPTNNAGATLNILAANHSLVTCVRITQTCGDPRYCQALSRSKLSQISNALQWYAAMNGNTFPASLSAVYRTDRGVWDPAVFWAPADSDPAPVMINNDDANRPQSTQISYAYLGGKAYPDSVAVTIVDNTLANNNGAGAVVATADGQVELFEKCSRFLPSTETARQGLRQIGQALQSYASANAGKFPSSLSMLYPLYVSNPDVFWSPGDKQPVPTSITNDTPDGVNSAQVSYRYLAASYTTGCDPSTVLLVDSSLANNGGTGVNILTADLQAEYYAPTPIACQYDFQCPLQALINLKEIGNALATYCTANNNRLPLRLSALYPQYIQRPTDFWHPGDANEYPLTIDNDGLNTENSAQISFEFLKPGADAGVLNSDDVIARDNTPANNNGNGVLTLFADFHVDYVPIRTIVGLAISGPSTVPENGLATYVCTATYSDSTQHNVTTAGWWYETTGISGFQGVSSGIYHAPASVVADLPLTLQFDYEDEGWNRFSTTMPIAVLNTIRIPTSLAITSGPDNVPEGTTAAYKCTVTYDDGGTKDVTAAATWSVTSGPGSFPTVGMYAAPASVTANTPATIHLSYTEAGTTQQADKTITVQNTVRVLTSLSIASGPASVAEGGTGAYKCTATYDDATTQNVTSTANWSVASGSGSFSTAGTYAAPATVLADTPVTIAASYSESGVTKQASKSITVLNSKRIVSSIAISSGPDSVTEGGIGSFVCTATYDDGTTQNVTMLATWSVTSGPGAFSSPGTYAAPDSIGAQTDVNILVSYAEGGVTNQASRGITVQEFRRTLTGISISSWPAWVLEGTNVAYICTAIYDSNESQDVTMSATWLVTSGPGSFTIPGTYATPDTVLVDTPATLAVSYTEGGVTMQAVKSIAIKNSVRKVTDLAWTSGPTSVPESGSGSYACAATFDDDETEDVTATATWSVKVGPGSFSSPGTYTAPASILVDTPVTLAASYTSGGATKEIIKDITVPNTVRVLASVAITSGPATVAEGESGKYACAATYDDGTTKSVTTEATWMVISGGGTFSAAGTYAAPAAVDKSTPVTITARYVESGVTKEASKSIVVEEVAPPVTDTDADDDGVADDKDRCPATPANTTVDANGCAASERDADSDGVNDNLDACANTPAGTAVNAAGCPDRDRDGTRDDGDNCPDAANADQADSDGDRSGDACDQCPGDASKTAPGNCGCDQFETAECGTPQTYTVRVVDAAGASVPRTYDAGTWADIDAPATPDGMRFSHWSGDFTGTDDPARILVDADKELVANYEDCPIESQPCGPGVPVCGVAATLALGLIKVRSWRSAHES